MSSRPPDPDAPSGFDVTLNGVFSIAFAPRASSGGGGQGTFQTVPGKSITVLLNAGANGMFAACDFNPGSMLKWANPNNLASWTELDFLADGMHDAPHSMVLDSGSVYISFDPSQDLNPPNSNFATVSKIDAATFAYLGDIVAAAVVGTDAVPQVNTYISIFGGKIYLATNPSTENVWVYSFDLTTGAPIASRQLTSTACRRSRAIVADASGVYVLGRRTAAPAAGWAAKLPLDLSSDTSATIGASANPTRSAFIQGGFIYCGDGGAAGTVLKVSTADLSVTSVTTGAAAASTAATDGGSPYGWFGFAGTPGEVRKVDLSLGSSVYTNPLTGSGLTGSVLNVILPSGIFVASDSNAANAHLASYAQP